MNTRSLAIAFRDNWYLLAAIVLCLGVATYKMTRPESASRADASFYDSANDSSGGVLLRNGMQAVRRRAQAGREKALATIRAHQQQIDENPEAEDAPALLAAMGNLNRQKLRDYEEAVRCYRLLLHDYPDWEGVRSTYVQLGTCYERLGDLQNADRLYAEMTKVFPETSQEHQFARAKLAGEIPSAP